MKFKEFKFLSLCLLVLFMTTGVIYAPRVLAVSSSSIGISMSPPNPEPFQDVKITLSSFVADLNSVNITWLVDNKVVLSGVGKKSLSITTKALNSETKVEARILLPDGEIDKRVTIKPSNTVLLWQANDSYVPPFYKGRALPTSDSEIKIVAIPEIVVNNKKINLKTMTYNWKLDYNNVSSASGYGKNYFTFINDYLENSNTVSVIATTADQQYKSESSISVVTTTPEIIFYKKDEKMGTLWEQALLNNHIIRGEEVVVAEPYFISPKNWRKPELVFYWSIDNRSVRVPVYAKNFIPLQTISGISGMSKLKLEIENTKRIFQTAEKEIQIGF